MERLESLPRSRRSDLAGLSRAALLVVMAYLLFCGGNRWLAERALAREAAALGSPPSFSYVFPEPLGPHRWRGVLRHADTYRLYLIHSLTGEAEKRGEVKSRLEDQAVQAARASPLGIRLERFFKAPVWEVSEPASPVEVRARRQRSDDPVELIEKMTCPCVLRFALKSFVAHLVWVNPPIPVTHGQHLPARTPARHAGREPDGP